MQNIIAELVVKSYMPRFLEPGMYFVNKNYYSKGEVIDVWQLQNIPQEPIESFIATNGAPVELCVIFENEEYFGVLATHEQIGWWDEGEHTDELRDIELKDINFILNECDGFIAIAFEENDEEEETHPMLYENKVVLSSPFTYNDDDDDEEDEDEFYNENNEDDTD